MELAPIVLFVYNRPSHTKKTLDALAKNDLAIRSDIFIYSDGPKNDEAEKTVKQVRELIKKVDGFKKVTVIERNRNWGLADSIVDGVTKVANEYGKVIVLEDDIVTSLVFLRYMNDALELYKNEERVMHVSGYFHPVENSLPETFFYNQSSCWGWGTWARAWKDLIVDIDILLGEIEYINNTSWYYKNSVSQLKANKTGSIKTWAVYWQMSILIKEGLCLHPSLSYVANIGHDGSGINSSTNVCFNDKNIILNMSINLNKISDWSESMEAVQIANKFLKKIQPSIVKRILIKIKII